MKANWSRNAFVYLLILVAGAALFFNISWSAQTPEPISLSTLAEAIREKNVTAISVRGDEIRVTLVGQKGERIARREYDVPVTQTLVGLGVKPEELSNVEIKYEAPSNSSNWLALLINLLPLIFIAGLFFILFRQTQGNNNQALSFGKSRARLFTGDKPTVTFDDIAGADEAKQELEEVVEFLKEPQKFAALGARIPKGVLLVGPPGTGKTLMAKAVSGEAGVPFFSISGSEFVEMFVGVGASRVRDLFEQAKRNSPCIIFIDEIDAVGRYRGTGLGGSHDEREQTLNQILVEMDGFGTDTNVILIAATNRPDILDPALLRPGRFDRRVTMDRPDIQGRRAILNVHAKGKPIGPDVDLESIARQTPGFVGADLENVVNEAAILAARRSKRAISMSELQEAVERIGMGGPERRSRLISPDDKKVLAYHEAGHAVAGEVVLDANRVPTELRYEIQAEGRSYPYRVRLEFGPDGGVAGFFPRRVLVEFMGKEKLSVVSDYRVKRLEISRRHLGFGAGQDPAGAAATETTRCLAVSRGLSSSNTSAMTWGLTARKMTSLFSMTGLFSA